MAGPAAATPTLIVSTAVTETDHAAIITVAAWLSLVAGVLCTLARIQIRWPLRSLSGWDDALCLVAALFAIIQTIIVLRMADAGFGRTENELSIEHERNIAKTIYATDLLFVISSWTGRASVSLLLYRLAGAGNKPRLYQGLTGLVAILGLISFLIVALRQHTSSPWDYTVDTADSTLHRWIVNGVLSVLSDLLAILVSTYLVWNLQMSTQPKTLVITAFALRLFVLPIIIIRLISLSRVVPDDFSLSYAVPEAYTQVEMHCNLIATTLPCLRLFLTAWNTSFMDMRLQEVDPKAYEEHVSSANKSYAHNSFMMSSMKRSKQSRSAADKSSSSNWSPPQPHGRSTAVVGAGDRDEDAASDNSERAIVVKQTVTVDQT